MPKPVIMSMWGNEEVPRDIYREAISALRATSRTYPEQLASVPKDRWPQATRLMSEHVAAIYRSREFCCQVYESAAAPGVVRLSFNRTETELVGNVCQWRQGISWDDLQRLKREAGYGERQAVEIFPADEHVVNVANMRHLWLLPEPLPFAWTKENR